MVEKDIADLAERINLVAEIVVILDQRLKIIENFIKESK